MKYITIEILFLLIMKGIDLINGACMPGGSYWNYYTDTLPF